MIFPNRTYDIIYADPPWMERGGGKIKRGADRHYRIDDAGKRAQGTTGFIALRTKHSEKPDEMRRMTERVSGFPGCREIELFAREQQNEWECWGNDLEGLKKSAREWAMREEQ